MPRRRRRRFGKGKRIHLTDLQGGTDRQLKEQKHEQKLREERQRNLLRRCLGQWQSWVAHLRETRAAYLREWIYKYAAKTHARRVEDCGRKYGSYLQVLVTSPAEGPSISEFCHSHLERILLEETREQALVNLDKKWLDTQICYYDKNCLLHQMGGYCPLFHGKLKPHDIVLAPSHIPEERSPTTYMITRSKNVIRGVRLDLGTLRTHNQLYRVCHHKAPKKTHYRSMGFRYYDCYMDDFDERHEREPIIRNVSHRIASGNLCFVFFARLNTMMMMITIIIMSGRELCRIISNNRNLMPYHLVFLAQLNPTSTRESDSALAILLSNIKELHTSYITPKLLQTPHSEIRHILKLLQLHHVPWIARFAVRTTEMSAVDFILTFYAVLSRYGLSILHEDSPLVWMPARRVLCLYHSIENTRYNMNNSPQMFNVTCVTQFPVPILGLISMYLG